MRDEGELEGILAEWSVDRLAGGDLGLGEGVSLLGLAIADLLDWADAAEPDGIEVHEGFKELRAALEGAGFAPDGRWGLYDRTIMVLKALQPLEWRLRRAVLAQQAGLPASGRTREHELLGFGTPRGFGNELGRIRRGGMAGRFTLPVVAPTWNGQIGMHDLLQELDELGRLCERIERSGRGPVEADWMPLLRRVHPVGVKLDLLVSSAMGWGWLRPREVADVMAGHGAGKEEREMMMDRFRHRKLAAYQGFGRGYAGDDLVDRAGPYLYL